MKKTKRIAAIALCALMAASTVACAKDSSSSSGSANSGNSSSSSSDKTYTVGICQLTQHPALDAATKGFKEALTKKLGDKVKFDEQNASGDSANCATIVNTFVANKVDLIMANATPALQAAASSTADIPVLGTSVTDYGTALQIKDFSGKTGRNISGTSDLAPLDKQAAMVKEWIPDAKKVGILYCSAEANSAYQVKGMTAELKKLGYTVKEYAFTDSNDIQTVTQKAADDSDVIYIPTDNTAASNTGIIDNICRPAKVPVIAGESGICSGCGVATLSISYYDLGYATGEMAYEILVNGKNPKDMDIQYSPTFSKLYNEAIVKDLGLTVPAGYEKITK